MTLNQIVDKLKRLGQSHAQLNTVRYGQLSEFLDRQTDNVYPLMFIDTPTLALQSKLQTYSFSIYFFDRVLTEKSNAREVESDMIEIAKDIYSMTTHPSLTNPTDGWYDPTSAQFTQVYDDTSADWLGGVRMDISLSAPFAYDRCAVPVLSGNFLLIDDTYYLLIDALSGRLMLQNS